jgi:hypothetical protein
MTIPTRKLGWLWPWSVLSWLWCLTAISCPAWVSAQVNPAAPANTGRPANTNTAGDTRAWRYESMGRKLAFFPTQNGWLEIGSNVLLSYNFARQEADYVELSRGNPPVLVRLYADRCDVSVQGGAFQRVHTGTWSESGHPFPSAARVMGKGGIRFPNVRGAFSNAQPFLAELWLRPNTDTRVGAMQLLACGPTNVRWRVTDDGANRFEVNTTGQNSFWLGFPKLEREWGVLHFGFDGQRLFLAFNGQGAAVMNATASLVADASGDTLVIGGDAPDTLGLWADVAAFRLRTKCDIPLQGAPSQNSISLRVPLDVPDTWQATADTRLLLDLPKGQIGVPADRSGRGEPVLLDRVMGIPVPLAPARIDVNKVVQGAGQFPPGFPGAPPGFPPGFPPGLVPNFPGGNPNVPPGFNAPPGAGVPNMQGTRPGMTPPNNGLANNPRNPTNRNTPNVTPEDLVPSKPNTPNINESAPKSRLTVPAENTVAQTLAQVRELNKADYEKAKSVRDKAALATKLGEQSRKIDDDPTARYVLRDEARKFAADAGQLVEAFAWIDEQAVEFSVDEYALKLAAAKRVHELLAASNAAPIALRAKMIDSSVAASTAAVNADRLLEADQLAQLALLQSRMPQVTDNELRRRVKEHADSVAKAKASWQVVADAEAKLKADPNDPDANWVVGKHRCFRRDQWTEGLPLLAKAADPKIAEAAQRDIQSANDVKGRLQAATLWEQASASMIGDDQRSCLARAVSILEQAMETGLRGLDREAAKQRLESLSSRVPTSHPRITVTMPDGAAVEVHPGMLGRMMVNGRDAGVLLVYHPGRPIEQSVFQTLMTDLKVKTPPQIEFTGFVVPLSEQMTLRQYGESRVVAQRLLIDGKSVFPADQTRGTDRADVPVSPSRHTLVWQVNGMADRATSRMEVIDRTSGHSISVFYTKQMLDEFRPSPTKKGENRREYVLNSPSVNLGAIRGLAIPKAN